MLFFAISNSLYIDFSLSGFQQITFTIPVTNTGSVAGAETVQLYIHDQKSSVVRPVKELKAFRKVFLQPGETQHVSMTIDRSALSFYDEATGQWKAESGKFDALVGTSSAQLPARLTFELR
jgi:beta-glucosidase